MQISEVAKSIYNPFDNEIELYELNEEVYREMVKKELEAFRTD